ncbi:unnamed protein product [Tetraodon nigroviridis]|uniref:(spotted green pufferfish) hypothetical protein n=1 Tax=Tetraodon nigroviridis TaxID=99883 RepID=Q4RQK3_TETNG|nr:unnamed protein product [Tetraodon nigroviridis]
MSGTHRFNTKYRAEEAEKLALRMKHGVGISKYKAVDYERLQAIIDAKRLETDALGEKNKQLQREARTTKESSILQQQRQYTHDITSSRELFMDMLQRLFPDRTGKQLLEHERVWDMWRYTQVQLRVVTQQWQRDYKELWNRALVTLEEANHAHQEELKLQKDRKHQRDVCLQLRKKTLLFRRCQTVGQSQVEEFEYLEVLFTELVVVPGAGCSFGQIYFCRDGQQNRSRCFYGREKKWRDRIVWKLCAIRVVAEGDPDRMMAHTEAWKSRHKEEECEDQRALYSLNTYTDAQIMSDPRVRIEQSLRKAGLYHSQYAKKVLSTIQPPKPPRKDTKSTFKF